MNPFITVELAGERLHRLRTADRRSRPSPDRATTFHRRPRPGR